MTIFITKKQSWIRLLAAFIPGIGICLLLWSFLSGPQLGPVYSILLRTRPGQPVSPELLLIDTSNQNSSNLSIQNQNSDETANILEPSAAASLLMTAAEMGAATIIIETPILGLSAGSSASEGEIRHRFNEEFGILSRNINSLFDAIRLGSVSPLEASQYVNDLVDLSEQAKERLASALVRRDEEGLERLEKAEKIFGDVRRPGDLLIHLIHSNEEKYINSGREPENEYFRANPDRDGVIRRVAPILGADGTSAENPEGPVNHIIYEALRGRFRTSKIENSDEGIYLVNNGRIVNSTLYPNDQRIALDSGGALLLNIPRAGTGFKKIHVKDFLDYDEACWTLRRLLGEAEHFGIYKNIEGEKNPVYLWDYSLALLDILLEEQNEENKYAWIRAKNIFFDAVDSFLQGTAEMRLISEYDTTLASMEPEDDSRFLIEVYRSSVVRYFDDMRQKHREILDLGKKLSLLGGSFCILGPFSGGESRGRISDAEASALLANSLLTGRSIKPGSDLWLLAGAIISLLLTAFLLRPLGAAPTLILGLSLSLFYGICFSVSFIISGVWIDPQIPAASSAVFTMVSFLWTLALKFHLSRSFKTCYGASISSPVLEKLILLGKPKPYDYITIRAAVIAVRNPELLVRGDVESPKTGAEAFMEFREKAANIFKQAGGTVLAGEGDTVLACFGSPLERTALRQGNYSPYEGHIKANDAPAARAADFVSGLLEKKESSSWHYGMDVGDCCFTWSPLSGYCGFGRPVIRARILASLVSRYEGRPLVTASMTSSLPDMPFKKIAVLKNVDGTNGEAFYEFLQ